MMNRTRRQRGFTLIELVVSLSITAVLMTGIASALVIASHAIPDPQSNAWAATPNAMLALDTVAADLMVAQTISEKTPAAVTFTVADRDNNALPETIRYAWAGTAGDPITRQLNNGTVTNLLDSADYFNLVYALATTTETTTSPTTTEPEGVVANHNGWGTTPLQWGISSNAWLAETFPLIPPAGATQLTFTRAKVKLRQGFADPLTTVSVTVHQWDSAVKPPMGVAIGTSATLFTSSLPTTQQWVEFTFANAVLANPNSTDTYALVVSGTTVGSAYAVYEKWTSAPVDPTRFFWTANGGGKWDPKPGGGAPDDYELPFYVYGSYTTNVSSQTTLTHYYVKDIEVSLNTQSADENEFVGGTPVLNMPEVSGP